MTTLTRTDENGIPTVVQSYTRQHESEYLVTYFDGQSAILQIRDELTDDQLESIFTRYWFEALSLGEEQTV